MNHVDAVVGVPHPKEVLAGGDGDGLDGLAQLEEEGVVDHVTEHGKAVQKTAELGHDGPIGAAAGSAPDGGLLLVEVLLRGTKPYVCCKPSFDKLENLAKIILSVILIQI